MCPRPLKSQYNKPIPGVVLSGYFFGVCEITIFFIVVAISDLVHNVETIFHLITCLQNMKILTEMSDAQGTAIYITVPWASLISQISRCC